MKPIRVYVAGPYGIGSMADNVRIAIQVGNELKCAGFSPFIPHLTRFWDLMFPDLRVGWLEYDLEWLAVCDAVFRIPGPSEGADAEVAYAKEHGIPVFESLDELRKWRGMDW